MHFILDFDYHQKPLKKFNTTMTGNFCKHFCCLWIVLNYLYVDCFKLFIQKIISGQMLDQEEA